MNELTVHAMAGPPALPAPQKPVPPKPAPLARDLRPTMLIGGAIVVLFFLVGGGWAAVAPLSGATIATGVVSPEGHRQTIQHLEGGIIREILVRDGTVVEAGAPLVVLEDIGAKAEFDTLTNRLRTLAAAESRLRAERDQTEAIDFSHPALSARDDPEVRATLNQEVNQFRTRKTNDDTRIGMLSQRILQLEQQIIGAQRQLEGVRRQNALIREEIAVVAELVRQGFERKPRLLSLQRAEAELLGTEGELVSRMARAQEAIGETKLQMMSVRTDRLAEVNQQLADIQAKRVDTEKQISQSRDRLKRTVIVAPVSGTILDVRFKTTGGVIRPGEPVLDIVPMSGELIIDGRISPRDIDDVYPGANVQIMFPSYSQRVQPRSPGKLVHVSADALTDPRTGESYYTAKVKVDRDELKREAPRIELTPGLPAELYIETSERTVLDYLVDPLVKSVGRSFREH